MPGASDWSYLGPLAEVVGKVIGKFRRGELGSDDTEAKNAELHRLMDKNPGAPAVHLRSEPGEVEVRSKPMIPRDGRETEYLGSQTVDGVVYPYTHQFPDEIPPQPSLDEQIAEYIARTQAEANAARAEEIRRKLQEQ